MSTYLILDLMCDIAARLIRLIEALMALEGGQANRDRLATSMHLHIGCQAKPPAG